MSGKSLSFLRGYETTLKEVPQYRTTLSRRYKKLSVHQIGLSYLVTQPLSGRLGQASGVKPSLVQRLSVRIL